MPFTELKKGNSFGKLLKNLIAQLCESSTHLRSSAEELSTSTEEVTASSIEIEQLFEQSSERTLAAAQTA